MLVYKVRNLLDITQPLLNHEYKGKIPSVLKAVVEVSREGAQDSTEPKNAKVAIAYIETEGIEIGKGTVFQSKEKESNLNTIIIKLTKTTIIKSTQYKIDTELIKNLISQTRKKHKTHH